MVRLSKLIVGVSLSVATLSLPVSVGAASRDAYVVVEGDTLIDIAASMGVPLGDLLRVNGLTVTSLILPGQRLEVPDVNGSGGSSPAATGPVYTVVAGDTLSGIASRHGVSLESLLTLNSLSVTSLIMPGMKVALPSGATAQSGATGQTSGRSGARSGKAATVVDFALAQVGKPYKFFTAGSATFDCSGLTMAAYGRVGISLIHHAATQAQSGSAVDHWNESIRAGDLVFLDNDWNGVIDHVGIAVNSTTWVHASESRGVVLTAPMPPRSVIVSVRRFVSTG